MFYSNEILDLSTAAGLRKFTNSRLDAFLPQLLYTIKLPYNFKIGGSIVNVYNISENKNDGQAYDMALSIPLSFEFTKPYFKSLSFSIGVNRPLSKNFYPTYSLDMKF